MLLQELQERLERTALQTPLLLVLNDVQWCDGLMLLALRAHPVDTAVVPVDPVGGCGGTDDTLDRLRRAGAYELSLGPLAPAAVDGSPRTSWERPPALTSSTSSAAPGACPCSWSNCWADCGTRARSPSGTALPGSPGPPFRPVFRQVP
ncbi:hypothetical protein [Streptomyces canus]|uniref:hypothetical protein n=1 Tax=Streptomyces canus TaxID=58343 RepID=UPI0027D7ABF6|nr:hypothetical protein [Streptomyces canus]